LSRLSPQPDRGQTDRDQRSGRGFRHSRHSPNALPEVALPRQEVAAAVIAAVARSPHSEIVVVDVAVAVEVARQSHLELDARLAIAYEPHFVAGERRQV